MRLRALVLILLVASGCHTMLFEVANGPRATVVYSRKSFYLFGLFPTKKVDMAEFCPDGVAAIREQTRFSDGFFSFITLDIWTPRSSWYYCLPEKGKP